MRSLIVTNSRSPKLIISRFRIHHARDTPIIVQYGFQAQSCYWRRSCGIELGDCSRVWNEWVHDQSLAQRSGQTFQRRTEDVGETYNNGSLYPEVSWARPADIGVVYRKKWSRWANVLSFYESRCNRFFEKRTRTWVKFSLRGHWRAYCSDLDLNSACQYSLELCSFMQSKITVCFATSLFASIPLNFIKFHGFYLFFVWKQKNSQQILHSRLLLAGTNTESGVTFSFRAKTTIAQRLPDDMEENVVQFHRFIIAARQRSGYPLSRIYNMDETSMRSSFHQRVHWSSAAVERFQSKPTEQKSEALLLHLPSL